jgi:hemerythrin
MTIKKAKLPVIKRKKFNVKEFIRLGKKVRKSFEEEEKYLREHGYPPSGFFPQNS